MEFEISRQFPKDTAKLPDYVRKKLKNLLMEIAAAENLNHLEGIKKMKGVANAYRIRIQDYRLGFFFEKDKIYISRILHRKEVYRYFP